MFGLILAAAAHAAAWPTYVNTRFAFAACYPSRVFHAAPEAPNSDGRTFSASDGATAAVFGSNDLDGTGASGELRQAARDRQAAGGVITYRAQSRSWAAISGRSGRTVFYEKAIARGDQVLHLAVTYPLSRSAMYRPIVEQMVRCFKAGSPAF